MTSRNRNLRHRQARRGVTLLLVLGLMTMFAMLVVTFMVVTTQAGRTSQSVAKMALRYDGITRLDSLATSAASMPTPDFDLAIGALLVGGLDTVIGPHSILENLYGNPNYKNSGTDVKILEGTVTKNSEVNIDSIFTDSTKMFTVTVSPHSSNYGAYLSFYDLIGSVLTIQYNDSVQSAVVATVAEVSGNFELQVVPLNATNFGKVFTDAGSNGVYAYINTRAFGGTGPGYLQGATGALLSGKDDQISDGELSTGGNGFELALRPNAQAPENDGKQPYKEYLENNLVLMNPDYTAPDYQNMFLAWSETQKKSGAYYIQSVIPSFHRPSLVNYWHQASKLTNAEDLRKVVFRPLRQDHPDFTGSNPAANGSTLTDEVNFLINGPWDVDNDGDGIQDGIWLDLGAATQTFNGRTYKALYSFYVLDMDGRLNVNTHGTDTTSPIGGGTGLVDPETGGLTDTYGSGSGVAELRLGEGLDMVSDSNTASKLFQGNTDANADHTGRYGSDKVPGASTTDGSLAAAAGKLDKTMGIWHGAYATPDGGGYTGYGGLLPDFSGEGAILFDALGNRTFDFNVTTHSFFAQNPYMMNPYYKDPQTDDSPFKVEDLEFLIRSVGDKKFIDELSETRLRYLIDSSDFDAAQETDVAKFSKYRHFVTTQSTDIPAAAHAGLGGYKGIFEYLACKIFGYNDNEADTHPDNVEAKQKADALARLLPPEVLRGEKMSLDRIMHLEANVTNKAQLLKEKARFAQEMFYLMMALCNEDLPATGDPDRPIAIARIAQWCVNLVDFLDTDDVMTPLVFHETDPLGNAFDFATSVPGFSAPGSGQRLVWGMEQPEVALTKTFATHNRRVADSKFGYKVDGAQNNPGHAGQRDVIHTCKLTTGEPCGRHLNRIAADCNCTETPTHRHLHDQSFDQVMIPQGSLFLELYRVGNSNRSYYKNTTDTANLYDANGKLDLAKTASGSPVWRLAISEVAKKKPGASSDNKDNDLFHGAGDNPDTYDFQPGSSTCNVTLERYIWFSNSSAAAGIPAAAQGCSYYNFGDTAGSSTGNVTLAPNECLVIGPRVSTSFLSKEVNENNPTFGIPDENADTQFDLSSLNTANSALKIMIAAAPAPPDHPNGKNNWSDNSALGNNQKGIGVSVSEPVPNNYYSDAPYAGGSYIHKDGSVDVKDACHDVEVFNDKVDFEPSFGTITRYKSVFLQRLADPSRAYNATTNPYITVDWNMIDLHVFNSERDAEGLADTDDTDLAHNIDKGLYFTMRQWGYTATTRSLKDRPNIWDRSFDTTEVNTEVETDGTTQVGAGLLVKNPKTNDRSTGKGKPEYLEDMKLGRPTYMVDATRRISNFYIEDPEGGVVELPTKSDTTLGDVPKYAYLHFPWNNGPLSNTYELMLVPASSPSRFGFEFGTPPTASAEEWWKSPNGTNPNNPTTPVGSLGIGTASRHMPICNPNCYVGPYFNFFNMENNEPKLSRLFDFVRVPSKFNGSVQGITADGKIVYRMREPGKINLNTTNEAAWEALRMGLGASFPTYEDFKKTIQPEDEEEGGGGSLPSYPTKFPFPIRPSASGNLVPIADLQYSDNPTVFRDVTRTISTADPDDPGSTDETATGLMFSPHDPDFGFTTNPGKGTNQRTALENAIRRSDMITNRSNVFAVWVTVGYFEVQQFQKNNLGNNDSTDLRYVYSGKLSHINVDNFDAIYPGGYVLGAEKGLDDGSVMRNRYFYLIDRSVPVGFRRGEKLNSENVIISSRSLE